MKLANLLTPERIVVPLRADDFAGGVEALLQRLSGIGAVHDASELAERIVSGASGEILHVTDQVAVVAARTPAVSDLTVALGVASRPLAAPREGMPEAQVRILLLLLTPRRLSTLKAQVIPTLARSLRDEQRVRRLMTVESAPQVLGFDEFMELEIEERLLVEDAVTPLTYRVYPETPLTEVVDLIVRRKIQAVPVVGKKHELLGIITEGDALRHLLPRLLSGEEPDGSEEAPVTTARDVMSRSVMGVSEEQGLVEAANLMVNKNVAQLPVVREGELIGFVTRDTLLKRLFGS